VGQAVHAVGDPAHVLQTDEQAEHKEALLL